MVNSFTNPFHRYDFGFDSPPPPSSPPLNFATTEEEDAAVDLTSPSQKLDYGFDSPTPPSSPQELQLSGEAALPEAKDFEGNGAFPPKADESRF